MKSRTQKLCDNFIYYRTKLSRSKMFFCRDIFKWVAFLESDIFPNLTARWCLNRLIQTAFIFCAQLKKKKRNCRVNCWDFECSSQLSKRLTIFFFMNTKQSLVRHPRDLLCFLNHSASGWLLTAKQQVCGFAPAANQIKEQYPHHLHTVCHIRRSTVRELCNWLVKVNRWSVNCSVSLWVSGDDLITDRLNMNEFILQ